MLKFIHTTLALLALTLCLATPNAEGQEKPDDGVGDQEKQVQSLNSHETGVDVLARRMQEMKLFDDFVCKVPAKAISDELRAVVNKEVWLAREIVLSKLKQFNDKTDRPEVAGAFPSHTQWLKGGGLTLSHAANSIVNVRNSFERRATEEERAILDSAEDNILAIVEDPEFINYYVPSKAAAGWSIRWCEEAAKILSMVCSGYRFDSESEESKRRSKLKKSATKLIKTLEDYQADILGLWLHDGAQPISYMGAEPTPLLSVDTAVNYSGVVVRALSDAIRAGYSVKTAVLEKALSYVTDTAVKLKYTVPKYYQPEKVGDLEEKGEPKSADADAPERVKALGWYTGHVPVESIDPKKKLLSEKVRENYRAARLGYAERIHVNYDLGESAMLVMLSKALEKRKSGKAAKEMIWPAIAKIVAGVNPKLVEGKGYKEGELTNLSHRYQGISPDRGVNFMMFAMLLGRERFGEIEWYDHFIRDSRTLLAISASSQHEEKTPPANASIRERHAYGANVLDSCSNVLEFWFYQPIGKEGVPESGKEGSKPISGDAKPAEGDDKAPERPEGDSKPKGEDKATKQD